jgi:hypothetical protein
METQYVFCEEWTAFLIIIQMNISSKFERWWLFRLWFSKLDITSRHVCRYQRFGGHMLPPHSGSKCVEWWCGWVIHAVCK